MSESNINVVIKMRPLIKRELDKKIPVCWRAHENTMVDSSRQNEFQFDSIFDENSTTAELYEKVARPIVSKALAGVNGTIFAYGQTSSGKTYTMMGDQGNDGIMTMAIKHIFNEVQSSNTEFVLRVGFIEIYNEKVYDLYDPENVDLKIVEINSDVNVNCREVICQSIDDMFEVIKIGNRNKKIGDTDMNNRSSRSHTIFHIAIESITAVSEKAKISSLNLVDLAGSERASQTNSTGTRFVEGIHINMSLLSLSKVINKLITNEGGHINYRDSKLTRYLQSSLGGNALAAIICTVCPTSLEETISTLYFAQRAMKVTNKPRVNEIISDATMIKKLHNQIEALKAQLSQERAKNGTDSAVPRLLQELSLHQGNILNYRSVESKHKLRRRTWNTFDKDLDVISENDPLILSKHKMSLTESISLNAVAPVLQIVNSGRGTGEQFDDFPDRDDEFNYKEKYENLLFEYEELLEFTNWEKELGVGPLSTSTEEKLASAETKMEVIEEVKMEPEIEQQYILQIEDLERERHRLEVEELQEQLRELTLARDALSLKLDKRDDEVEQRLAKMNQVEVELVELRNNITVLSNTILTLENEKREMSVRFNESMSGSTFECLLTTPSALLMVPQSCQTDASEPESNKLQSDYDEMSCKVMDLIEENEDFKQKVKDLDEKLAELNTLLAEKESEAEAFTAELKRFDDNSETQSEEVALLKSEKVWLEKKVEEIEKSMADLEAKSLAQAEEVANARESKESVEENAQKLEEKLKELEANLLVQFEEITVLRSDKDSLAINLQQSEDKIQLMERQMQEVLRRQEELNGLKEESEKITVLQKEIEELINGKEMLELDIKRVCEDRDSLIKELDASTVSLREMTDWKEVSSRDLEKLSQEVHSLIVERDCLANEMKDKLALISELEKNVEERELELQQEVVEKAKINGELNDKYVELERMKTELNAIIDQLRADASDFDRIKEALQEEAVLIKQELSTKCEELEKINEELITVTSTINNVTEERDQLDSLVRNSTDQMKEIEQVKASLEQEVAELKDVIATKNEEMEMMQTHLKTATESQQSSMEWEKERERLSSDLEAQLQRIHSLTNEVSTLTVTLGDMEADLQEKGGLSSTVKDLQLELMAKNSKILDLETELEKLSAVEREMLEMNEFKSSMALKSESQLERIHQLSKEKNDVKLELDNLRDELAEKDEELKMAKEQSNHAQKELQVAQSQHSQVCAQVKQLENRLVQEMQKGNERTEELNKKMSSLKEEIERKTVDLATIQTNYRHLSQKAEGLELKLEQSEQSAAEKVREFEKTKMESLNEIGRLNVEKKDGEERLKHLAVQLEEAKSKCSQLEVELARRGTALAASSREDVFKLKDEIKRLRSELNDHQHKERRARRSSIFDVHRDLLSRHSVGTMTDPVSEACQCEMLNEKVVELKKKCMIKDIEIVEIRESQKRSPMLLENYSLKKLVEQYKEREVALHKQIPSKKETATRQTQTLPDPLLEKYHDAQECLRVTKHKYEMAKNEIKNARKQLQEMEAQLERQTMEFEEAFRNERKRQDENDAAQANLPAEQPGKKYTVQQKYDFVKKIMEKRFHMIKGLQAELQALSAQKSCVKCRAPL